jgi:hypothetical protein
MLLSDVFYLFHAQKDVAMNDALTILIILVRRFGASFALVRFGRR